MMTQGPPPCSPSFAPHPSPWHQGFAPAVLQAPKGETEAPFSGSPPCTDLGGVWCAGRESRCPPPPPPPPPRQPPNRSPDVRSSALPAARPPGSDCVSTISSLRAKLPPPPAPPRCPGPGGGGGSTGTPPHTHTPLAPTRTPGFSFPPPFPCASVPIPFPCLMSCTGLSPMRGVPVVAPPPGHSASPVPAPPPHTGGVRLFRFLFFFFFFFFFQPKSCTEEGSARRCLGSMDPPPGLALPPPPPSPPRAPSPGAASVCPVL